MSHVAHRERDTVLVLGKHAKLGVESLDNVDNVRHLCSYLLQTAEDVPIVLGNSAHPRETEKFALLFVAVDRSRLHITDRELFITPLGARIDLRVVRAVHRLHHEFCLTAAFDVKKVILEFFPVAARLVEFALGDVGDSHSLVAVLFLKGLYLFYNQVAHQRALGSKEGQSRADEVREGKEPELSAKLPMVAQCRFLL